MLVTLRDQRVKGSGGWTLSKKGKRKKERKGSSDGYAIVTIQV